MSYCKNLAVLSIADFMGTVGASQSDAADKALKDWRWANEYGHIELEGVVKNVHGRYCRALSLQGRAYNNDEKFLGTFQGTWFRVPAGKEVNLDAYVTNVGKVRGRLNIRYTTECLE